MCNCRARAARRPYYLLLPLPPLHFNCHYANNRKIPCSYSFSIPINSNTSYYSNYRSHPHPNTHTHVATVDAHLHRPTYYPHIHTRT